ncbi:hypothetical protein QWJ07_02975 [Frankia sp. RB7]|nr:hypothetical protein [Frankia sp. RB7]
MAGDDKSKKSPEPETPLTPMGVLNAARKAVPAVDYALAVAGVAAAGSIVLSFLGTPRSAAIVLGGMFVAMVLFLVFVRLLATKNHATILAAQVLMWMVIVFFGTFLAFTITAFAARVPIAWVQFLGIEEPKFDRKAMDRLLEVPPATYAQALKGVPDGTVKLLRLQPMGAGNASEREAVLRGGGAYYSFARGTHEYGAGSDIGLEGGTLRVGFAGANYGFFLDCGPQETKELAIIAANTVPRQVDSSRTEAWNYMWSYRPPQDIKDIRKDQNRSRGFRIGSASLSEKLVAAKGNLYLLRSINVRDSDILVALQVIDVLDDHSVILAWRLLNAFDTPIATGKEE